MKRILSICLAASFAFAFSGCGSSGPDVSYVEGVVTLDGAPLAGATIAFSPASPEAAAAVGISDASGVFKVSDVRGGDFGGGAAPGNYEVSVIKNVGGASSSDPEAWKTDPNYGKEVTSPTGVTAIKSEIPKDYNDPKKSGLTVTVKKGSNKDIKLELKKDYKFKK